MKYRKFKAADIDVSLLGFGAMRLPSLGRHSEIDEEESIRMIRHAIDNGVNYVDTAYVYHGMNCENLVGKALADGYREKAFLATKLPFWMLEGPDEIDRIIDEQLAKLMTDHIDFYLIHDVRGENWDTVLEWDIWNRLDKNRSDGKLRYIGFSFHGETPEEFKKILDAYPWDFCQLQLNYMDTDIQAGMEGYEYAVLKGVPVIIMEPLKGGKLTDIMPPQIQKYWDDLGSERSPAEWAMRWAANLPGVLTILSGMSAMEHVVDNIRILSNADADSLSEAELMVIDKVAQEYRKLIPFPCTACKYCMPCQSEINIPVIIDFRNSSEIYGHTPKLRGEFLFHVKNKPSACTACGSCEEACPQHLEIIKIMKESAELFEKKK